MCFISLSLILTLFVTSLLVSLTGAVRCHLGWEPAVRCLWTHSWLPGSLLESHTPPEMEPPIPMLEKLAENTLPTSPTPAKVQDTLRNTGYEVLRLNIYRQSMWIFRSELKQIKKCSLDVCFYFCSKIVSIHMVVQMFGVGKICKCFWISLVSLPRLHLFAFSQNTV